jgi:hypothetical protein
MPLSVTLGELARRIDVSPGDVLGAAIDAGIQVFWHEGRQFRTAAYLRCYLQTQDMQGYQDPVPQLEVDLSPEEIERLAAELSVEPQELSLESATSAEATSTSHRPLRKFVASQPSPPNLAGGERKQKSS